MKLTSAGIDLIKSRESCRLKAYRCPAGVLTIGYGHTGAEVHDGWEITQDEADSLLRADLLVFDASVQRDCPAATPAQHDAMVDLCFNIGCGAFAKSSVCRLHNAGKYGEAAQAFGMWNKAGGKILPGLVARRAAEAAMYLSDCPADNAPSADGEKPLTASRTVNGGALTGLGTGAAVVSQLAPAGTLDTIKDALGGIPGTWAAYAILALTLTGIALTVYARLSDRREGRA